MSELLIHNDKACVGNHLNFKREFIVTGGVSPNIICNYMLKNEKRRNGQKGLYFERINPSKDNRKIIELTKDSWKKKVDQLDKSAAYRSTKLFGLLVQSRHPKVICVVKEMMKNVSLADIQDHNIPSKFRREFLKYFIYTYL